MTIWHGLVIARWSYGSLVVQNGRTWRECNMAWLGSLSLFARQYLKIFIIIKKVEREKEKEHLEKKDNTEYSCYTCPDIWDSQTIHETVRDACPPGPGVNLRAFLARPHVSGQKKFSILPNKIYMIHPFMCSFCIWNKQVKH